MNKVAKKVKILYKNYRGETSVRRIIPIELIFQSTQWHNEQWLLRALDLDKNEERKFAFQDIKAWWKEND